MAIPDETIYSSMMEALRQGTGRPVALCVRVLSVSSPELGDEEIPEDANLCDPTDPNFYPAPSTIRIRFSDVEGSCQFDTFPVKDLDLGMRAQAACRDGHYLVVRGILLNAPVPNARRGAPVCTRLLLSRVEPLTRVSALLGATPQEIARADALLDRLAAQGEGALRTFFTSELFDILGITDHGLSRRFRQCVDLTLLQSLSCGQVRESVNPRISSYIVSAPGRAKKPLAEMAEALGLCSVTVQPALCTPAGLAASVEQGPGGWKATPGALPRGNMGTVTAGDAHRFPKGHITILHACFMSALEDGKVTTSKAAAASYEARCAVHLNGNLQCLLDGDFTRIGPHERVGSLGMTWEMVTRIDVLTFLDPGDDAEASARAIVRRRLPAITPEWRQQVAGRRRQLKLLVARLMERYPTVDTSAVTEEMDQLMQDVALVLRRHMGRLSGPEQHTYSAESLVRRMGNSLLKLVGASARLRGSGVATVADVDRAWEMLALKIEALHFMTGDRDTVLNLGTREQQVRRARREEERRFEHILEYCGGQVCTAAELAEGMKCGVSLVQRILRDKGIRPEGGAYRIPTETEYEAWVAAWAQEEMKAAQEGRPAPAAGEDEIEECEEEMAEEPDEPEEFDCGLPPLPAALKPVVRGIEVLNRETKEDLADAITTLLYEEKKWIVDLKIWKLEQAIGHLVDEGTWGLLEPLLREPRTRVLTAAQLYVNTSLPDRLLWFRTWLRDEELPDETKECLACLVRQLEYEETLPPVVEEEEEEDDDDGAEEGYVYQ